jgi:hypothetical protein
MIKLKMVLAMVQVRASCVGKSLTFQKGIINQRNMHWFPDQVLV